MPRPGLVVKFSRIRGVTGKGVLRQPLTLPAVTDDFAFTEEAPFEDYDTVTGGEYSQPAAWRGTARRRLRRLDITFLTVDFDPPWVQSRRDQATIREAAFGMLRGRTPVRMEANVYPDPGYTELEMNVTIRSITRTLRPGLAQARYFDLAVTEWRDNAIQRRSSTASRRRGTVSLPTTHTLATGDTLMRLSERYYGFFGGWRQIAQENGLGHWGPNTPLSQIGGARVGRTKLRIPEKPDLVSEDQISGGRSGTRPQYSGGDG